MSSPHHIIRRYIAARTDLCQRAAAFGTQPHLALNELLDTFSRTMLETLNATDTWTDTDLQALGELCTYRYHQNLVSSDTTPHEYGGLIQ